MSTGSSEGYTADNVVYSETMAPVTLYTRICSSACVYIDPKCI